MATLAGCGEAGEDGASSADTSGSSSMSSSSANASAGSEGEPEFESLIDHEVWEVVDEDDDPLAEHRPEELDCGVGGWYLESDGPELEVDTNLCNYLALAQPSLRPIDVGDTLAIRFYHFDLVAPEPAEAHLRVTVDGNEVWDYEVEIPTDPENNKTPAAVFDETFAAEFSAPLGSEVMLHVHNHGQNTWTFVDLAVAPGP